MKRIGIIANCTKARVPEVLKHLGGKAKELGFELASDEATARLLQSGKVLSAQKLCDEVDAVMVLGGDGTMLRAVRELDGRDKPVIGVNVGGLGFLTSVAEQELDRALECLAKGDFNVSVRAIADCVVRRGNSDIACYRGLNDVVVTSGQLSRVVTLDVRIDDEKVTSYVCDGLIVSTPTGSTGHSLSAGGPILPPDTPAFVISPICPHTLSSRPLVVPDRSTIEVIAAASSGDLRLSVDGQVGQTLAMGDCVKVKRSDRSVRIIHLPGYNYFSVLRQKLHWRGSAG